MLAVTIATLAGAYLIGSFPTGYLVGKARGVDLRAHGSGNIGATNALRVLGKPAGIFVLLADAFKGWLACAWLPHAVHRALASPGTVGGTPDWLPLLGGLAAVIGHNFTCWLRFKGGKGIATSAGVLLGLVPTAAITVLGIFLVALLVSRIVSLSSLIAAGSLPVAAWYWHRQPLLVGFAGLLAALAFHRHRANIRRLIAGTEPRIGQKPAPQTAPPPGSQAP